MGGSSVTSLPSTSAITSTAGTLKPTATPTRSHAIESATWHATPRYGVTSGASDSGAGPVGQPHSELPTGTSSGLAASPAIETCRRAQPSPAKSMPPPKRCGGSPQAGNRIASPGPTGRPPKLGIAVTSTAAARSRLHHWDACHSRQRSRRRQSRGGSARRAVGRGPRRRQAAAAPLGRCRSPVAAALGHVRVAACSSRSRSYRRGTTAEAPSGSPHQNFPRSRRPAAIPATTNPQPIRRRNTTRLRPGRRGRSAHQRRTSCTRGSVRGTMSCADVLRADATWTPPTSDQ